jgi:RNA polymerase sigma-70 factor (ECF subfamily)
VRFDSAYEQNVSDVYGYLALRGRSPEEAEDLTTETFERALKAWSRFDPRGAEPRTWLLGIARNVYIDSRRRGAPVPAGPPEGLELTAGPRLEERLGPDPELASALGKLKRPEREAIALCFGAELSIADVAEVTGASIPDVQQILSRSLRRLRALL